MDTANFSRRDFLNLLALAGIASVGSPLYSTNRSPANKRTGSNVSLPNLLLLVFDTLSAHHLSLFGYQRETTPNLARFAERATVFHNHYAGGNFTVPGTASLLTGTYPWSHYGLHLFGTVREKYVDRNIFNALADDYFITTFTHNYLVMGLLDQFQENLDRVTLPEDLAILSGPLAERMFPGDFVASYWGERIIRGSGSDLPGSLFLSFFEDNVHSSTPRVLKRQYGDLFPRGLPNNTMGVFFLLEDAIDWIQKEVAEVPQPFFGYFHLFPPHEPYMTRKEFVDIFDDGWEPESKPVRAFPQNKSEEFLNSRRRHYDEYLAFADAEFGRLYDFLRRTGILDNTCFILTSDHGQLFEREIHGHVTATLYEPLVHVPLIISKPGQRVREDITTPTSCVDLLPTILNIAGKPLPDWCQGQILPSFGTSKPNSDRNIYAVEAKKNPRSAPLKMGTVSMIKGRYKLIRYFGYQAKKDNYELYDLQNDPEEYEDLYQSRKKSASELKGELLAGIDDANRKITEGEV